MGREFIKVPPDFAHPKDPVGVFIPGAHLELLYSLPPERRTHFQLYETTSEGTPVSPIFPSEDALDNWINAQRKVEINSRRLAGNLVGRPVPGTQGGAKDREFMYIESPEDESFRMLVRRAFDDRSVARPKLGGVMEARIRIRLKDGISLLGITYNRDIEGWRAGFVGLCAATGRNYGLMKDGRLILSNGETPSLEELEVTFE